MPCATISVQLAVPRRRGTGLRGCCRAPQAAAWLLAASTSYEHKGGIAKACGSRKKAFQPTAHKDAPRLKARVSRTVADSVEGGLVVASISEDVMKLQVVLEPSDEGGFTALVPALPGCISEGDTRDEALVNVQEAVRLYLEPVDDDATLSPHAEVIEIAV